MIPIFDPDVPTPCREPGREPDDYFPEERPKDRHIRQVCAGCPVMSECRSHAAEHHEKGIWGGTYFK